ncbi:SDR family oxidoreductase [Sporosarcina sp. 179-K 8C2 HS]|uniref:SDR family oxidoreductase n=1 Tax=Sporosarcina sp. 179-K 8C2 HS TaxID=3142387 RepID=UPI0039A27DB1
MTSKSLFGKTIAITGSSKGIGKETATLLQGLGANLVLGSRSNSKSLNGNALELPLDVTNEESVKNFFLQAINQFGKVDVLINSAGVGVFESIVDSSTEDFDNMLSINLRGTYLTCKHFGRHMAELKKGHILNLVSIAGTTALPGCGGYSASKFGVVGLTKVLQTELRGKGVQVTSVIPGSVSSSFWDDIETDLDTTKMIPTNTVAKHLVYLITQPPGAFIDEITIMPPQGIL